MQYIVGNNVENNDLTSSGIYYHFQIFTLCFKIGAVQAAQFVYNPWTAAHHFLPVHQFLVNCQLAQISCPLIHQPSSSFVNFFSLPFSASSFSISQFFCQVVPNPKLSASASVSNELGLISLGLIDYPPLVVQGLLFFITHGLVFCS